MKFLEGLNLTDIIGAFAGLLTAVSMLPQVIKTLKEKKAEDVSLLMLIVLMSGLILWIWYGLSKNDYPIIITNSVSLTINIIMIYLRYKYRDKGSEGKGDSSK